MRGTRGALVVLAVLLLALGACGGEPAGPAGPVPVPSSTSALPPPPDGPSPEAARDLRGFVGRPCDLLPPEQAGRLGLRGPGPLTVGGPGTPPVGCFWLRGASADVGVVQVLVAGRDLLAEVYRGYAPRPDRSLVPGEVTGLPAVTVAPVDGYVRCELTVRPDAGQGFTVSVRQSALEVPQGCGLAREVAGSVVSALPRRAG